MYLRFYNLKEEPFSLSPDPDFLYLSEVHREGLANLRYGLIQKKGFIVITGEVGTGKTTLINALLSEIPQEVKTAFISNPKLKTEEFFFLLSRAFKLGNGDNKAKFLINFTEFLERLDKNGENVVLIIDEAHCLPEKLLEEIRLLSNLETPHSKLLNIILVGQPEFEKTLDHPGFRALKQRITLRYRLKPLSKEETREYIKVRLSRAGSKDVGVFSEGAISAIYRYSKGVPRVINLLADRAMLTGFVKETKVIDDKIIRECAAEIGFGNAELNRVEKDRLKKNDRETKTGRHLLRAGLAFLILGAILAIFWFVSLSNAERQKLITDLTILFSGELWEK